MSLPGEPLRYRILLHVRVSQPIREYTAIQVDWTNRTVVFNNTPTPVKHEPTGRAVGIDRGCVHAAADSDGRFMDLPKDRLKAIDREIRKRQKSQARRIGNAGYSSEREYVASGKISRAYRKTRLETPSVEESAGMTDADWAKLGNDFMQRMGLMNHQYIIVKHSGTEKNSRQAHLHILANRVSLSGELYKDNWIGKRATEAANSIARERNLVQSKDIGKANREEIKQAMDGILARMQGFDLAEFSRELEKLGFRVREARASTGKLNGYYVTSRSGTEYKASEIGKGYTLAHIEKTQKKLKV